MRIVICACGAEMKNIGRTEVCIACFVRESTAAQGLPEKVEDPMLLHDVAVLMQAGARQRAQSS